MTRLVANDLDNGPVTASPSSGPEPRQSSRQHRRDEILRTAAELFAANGYTTTSMREVAAASGILAGSLYHHFVSKEAIAVELVENYHADLARVVRTFSSDQADPVAAMRAFARAISEVSFRHRAALQITMFDAPSAASPSLKAVVHAEPASLDRRWRTLISTACGTGAILAGVDQRILRHVLHRTALQSGLSWERDGPAGVYDVADCVTAIVFGGLASTGPIIGVSKAIRVVDDATARWDAEAAERHLQRPSEILEVARAQFALRGFEATTIRDIADAAGLTASNLYRYFESKDSMVQQVLASFSDRLLETYRDVIQVGSSVVETLDAILWLLDQAGRHFSHEIEILRAWRRLLSSGVADHYQEGAQIRLTLLASLIERGVAAGELNAVAAPDLVASCLREIMWAPMRNLAPISSLRVRDFYRHSVLSGAAARR